MKITSGVSFFFSSRRRHTRWNCDWSSDVCSSDLRALVLAEPDSAGRSVADAVRAHPAWTSGTARSERALHQAVPGLLVKSGAEGVQAFALADGRAGAVKMEDGGPRAIPAITVALLRVLGADREPGTDREALDRIADLPVLGGGEPVGEIRASLPGWPDPML